MQKYISFILSLYIALNPLCGSTKNQHHRCDKRKCFPFFISSTINKLFTVPSLLSFLPCFLENLYFLKEPSKEKFPLLSKSNQAILQEDLKNNILQKGDNGTDAKLNDLISTLEKNSSDPSFASIFYSKTIQKVNKYIKKKGSSFSKNKPYLLKDYEIKKINAYLAYLLQAFLFSVFEEEIFKLLRNEIPPFEIFNELFEDRLNKTRNQKHVPLFLRLYKSSFLQTFMQKKVDKILNELREHLIPHTYRHLISRTRKNPYFWKNLLTLCFVEKKYRPIFPSWFKELREHFQDQQKIGQEGKKILLDQSSSPAYGILQKAHNYIKEASNKFKKTLDYNNECFLEIDRPQNSRVSPQPLISKNKNDRIRTIKLATSAYSIEIAQEKSFVPNKKKIAFSLASLLKLLFDNSITAQSIPDEFQTCIKKFKSLTYFIEPLLNSLLHPKTKIKYGDKLLPLLRSSYKTPPNKELSSSTQ